MDSNATLSRLRELAAANPAPWKARGHWDDVEQMQALFRDLDAHLSAGGTPPEAWREGPDAPELDDGVTEHDCTMPERDHWVLPVREPLPDPLGPPNPAGVDLPSAPHYWAMPDTDAAAWR